MGIDSLEVSWTDWREDTPSFKLYPHNYVPPKEFRYIDADGYDTGTHFWPSSSYYLCDKLDEFSLVIPTRDEDSFKLWKVPHALGIGAQSKYGDLFRYPEEKDYYTIIRELGYQTPIGRTITPEYTEYSVDLFLTQSSNLLDFCQRERVLLSPKGCYHTRTKTYHDLDVVSQAFDIAYRMELTGLVNLQCFKRGNHPPLWFDVNPRIGGSSIASYHAGVDWPQFISDIANGIEPKKRTKHYRELDCYFYWEHFIP